MLFTLGELETVVKPERMRGASTKITGVAADSRDVGPGDLFVALAGERTDGHLYLDQAFAQGASAALIRSGEDHRLSGDAAYLAVSDPLHALGQAAAWYLSRFDVTLIGVTGSVGKTTCKDMIAGVLGQRFSVLKTPGSYNTEIGMPLTVFRLRDHHQIAVMEMGMRKPGDLQYLAELFRPSIGVLTNVRESHLEFFGSIKNIAQAKSELFEALPPEGWAILNGEDPWSLRIASQTPARCFFYNDSEATPNPLYATDIAGDARERPRFKLWYPDEGFLSIRLPIAGRHHVANALAAGACAYVLGMPGREVMHGLSGFASSEGRMEWMELESVLVLNDAYNSSPTSCRAALDVLGRVEPDRRKVAVLGTMGELGDHAKAAHQSIGREVAERDIEVLVTIGAMAKNIGKGALRHGFDVKNWKHYADNPAFLDDYPHILSPGDVILIKASRACQFETHVRALREHYGTRVDGEERACSR